ncbi:hypothetical protein Anapl_17331, partial [Anas platyrhynchos]
GYHRGGVAVAVFFPWTPWPLPSKKHFSIKSL